MQEIWTLCRILKRNVSQRKQITEMKQVANKRQAIHETSTGINNNMEFNTNQETYINFGANHEQHHINEDKPVNNYTSSEQSNQFHANNVTPSPNIWIKQDANELLSFDNWDELGSVVRFAVDLPSL